MNKTACSAVICQPGGREQKHDITNCDHSGFQEEGSTCYADNLICQLANQGTAEYNRERVGVERHRITQKALS